MPNGRVMRIDEKRQCIYVVRRGRSYPAQLSEVDTAARVPGARVRYKLRRVGGVEHAEQVELRTGTRTNKRQRRFGDLTGARKPGTRVPTSGQSAYGIDVATQPFNVVDAWISALGQRNFDAATSLYLPGAVLHLEDESVSGRARIRASMESCTWVDVDTDAVHLHGLDRYVVAERLGTGSSLLTYFVIEQGQVAEQWLGAEPEVDTADDDVLTVHVVPKGTVSDDNQAYAQKRIEQVIANIGTEALYARMKLSQAKNPADDNPSRAECTLDLDGLLIRAHAAAPSMTEAIDLVVARLHSKLEHRRDRERHKATGLVPPIGEWRQGYLRSTHPPYFERDPEDREIVRHKSFAPDEMTVEEAVWDMSLLDYDFFLFVELSTGRDCLVERTDAGEAILHVLGPDGEHHRNGPDDLPTSDEIPPTMKPSEAIRLLDQSGQPFLFFNNVISSRGNVVYRRYDGHYGLITPPVED